MRKRTVPGTVILLCMLLLALCGAAKADEAENITGSCTVKLCSKNARAAKITDGLYTSYWDILVHSKLFTLCFHLFIFSGLIASSLILSLTSLESSLLLKPSTELLNSVVHVSSQISFLLNLVL